ncbi:Hypothetical predicted protein [Mytilus galloprovincialis]|uniref:Uncharacterized protein n=1 Tax=Mytilus galloprovincialis TaxID=29158 RepID=A0A8B6F593_MYTGA|nr:Hypothetical predicted protein [Mytilus galloprovincialis]
MENYYQHMIDQLVKVIPQDVLQKLQQLSAQDLQSVKQQNLTKKQLEILSAEHARKHDVKKNVQKEDDVKPPRKRQRTEDVDQLPEERVRNAREKRSLTATALNDGVENIQLQPNNNEERYDLMLFVKEKQVDIVQILEERLLKEWEWMAT